MGGREAHTPGVDGPVVMPSFLDPNAPTKLIDFVAARPSSQRPQKMISTPMVGACVVCKIVGTFDVPADFDFKTGDKMLAGKILNAFCPTCRRVREMRALSPEELTENQFFIMRRYYELYKHLLVDGQELPFEIKQFVDAYEKRMQDMRQALGIGPALPGAPAPEVEPPKIITP